MTKTYIYILLSAATLFSQAAIAGGYFRLGAMYIAEQRGLEGATSDVTRTMWDIGGGYVGSQGWTVGLLYGTEKINSGSSFDRSSFGPSVGWATRKDDGPYAMGTYFLSPTMSGGFKGTGYQFDVGYKFKIRNISFAPQISKKHFEYDDQNGQAIDPKFIDDRIDPYFVVWVDIE
jgi:hypothetical protein